jgi:hypothetical protein
VQSALPQPTPYTNKTRSSSYNSETKAPLSTYVTCTEEACETYRKTNSNNTQRKKYSTPSSRISAFALSLQDDGEEVGDKGSEKDTRCGFCNIQYKWLSSSQIGHLARVYEILCSTMRNTLEQQAVTDFCVESYVTKG